MNSSQLKRKRETIKLENIVILTSLSTITLVCLFTETLKRHGLEKTVPWYCCQVCSSGKQNFIGFHDCHTVLNIHCLHKLLSFGGHGEGQKGKGEGERA